MTKTKEDVQAFLNMLPDWAPAPSLEREKIVLEWEGEGKCVSVSFDGDGSYSYSYTSRGGDISGPFFKDIEDGLPESFLLMIEAGLKLGDLSEWK